MMKLVDPKLDLFLNFNQLPPSQQAKFEKLLSGQCVPQYMANIEDYLAESCKFSLKLRLVMSQNSITICKFCLTFLTAPTQLLALDRRSSLCCYVIVDFYHSIMIGSGVAKN